jgi:hypothetical protein
MTYSPTMKLHNYFPKNILYSIFLIYILSSCASLNSSNQTYNLEGKFSYVSKDYSAIFLVDMATDLSNIKINLYEPINGTLLTSLKGSNDAWKISNEGLKNIESIFPNPKELLYIVRNKCLKNNNCKFDFSTENNVEVKVLLKNV